MSRCSSTISRLAPAAKVGRSKKLNRHRRKRICNISQTKLAARRAADPPQLLQPILLARAEVCPPVLLPARFVRVVALWTLLTVADGFQPVGGNAQLNQKPRWCSRAAV